MAKLHPNHRKHVRRLKAQAQAQRVLALKKKGERLIPDKILRQLASLNLPPNEFVYQACLEKLLRSA
jgi:hypothetical protein